MSAIPFRIMSNTHNKSDSNQFKPIELVTHNKDHHGITKTVHTHITRLHVLLTDWIKMIDKGGRLFRGIAALKLHECLDEYYPSQMKPLIQGLLEIIENLRIFVDAIGRLNVQLQALAQLQPGNEPVISTWSASQISKAVSEILESLLVELKLKETTVENIAHCRNEQLIEVYCSAWEYNVYFNIDSTAYLFAEVGLSVSP